MRPGQYESNRVADMPQSPFDDLIGSQSDRLTRTDRRIASLILEDPTRLAFGTVADLAAEAETSGPSIVRFATKLGFEGFSAMQTYARTALSAQLARPRDRLVEAGAAGAEPIVQHAFDKALGSIRSVVVGLDDGRVERIGALMAGASSVYILSGEIGMAGANILASALGLVRDSVLLVGPSNLDVALATSKPDDVVIVIDFVRYKRWTVDTMRLLKDRDVPMVAITDGALSPLASLSQEWVGVSVPAVGPFDSSVSAVMVAEILVAEVARQLSASAADRLDAVEDLWISTNRFHLDD